MFYSQFTIISTVLYRRPTCVYVCMCMNVTLYISIEFVSLLRQWWNISLRIIMPCRRWKSHAIDRASQLFTFNDSQFVGANEQSKRGCLLARSLADKKCFRWSICRNLVVPFVYSPFSVRALVQTEIRPIVRVKYRAKEPGEILCDC